MSSSFFYLSLWLKFNILLSSPTQKGKALTGRRPGRGHPKSWRLSTRVQLCSLSSVSTFFFLFWRAILFVYTVSRNSYSADLRRLPSPKRVDCSLRWTWWRRSRKHYRTRRRKRRRRWHNGNTPDSHWRPRTRFGTGLRHNERKQNSLEVCFPPKATDTVWGMKTYLCRSFTGTNDERRAKCLWFHWRSKAENWHGLVRSTVRRFT